MNETKFGFGAWGLSGDAYGEVSEDSVDEVLQTCSELGVTLIDHSPNYRNGLLEPKLGKYKERNGVLLCTRLGILPHLISQSVIRTNFSQEYIVDSVNKSLLRQKVDSLDLLQIDCLPVSLPGVVDETMETIEKLIGQGKIVNFGFSLRSPKDLEPLIELCKPNFIQLNFSLLDQRMLEDFHIIKSKMPKGIKFIARTPLHYGLLTDNFNFEYSKVIHLRNWPSDIRNIWVEVAREYALFSAEIGLTLNALALSFIKSVNIFDYVIPGATESSHLRSNFNALNMRHLTTHEISRIRFIYSQFESKLRVRSPYNLV